MSKMYSDDDYRKSTEKIIEIKPIEVINPNNGHRNSGDGDGNQTQNEILVLKRELQELEEKKANLIKDTLEQIRLEKSNWEKEKDGLVKQANKSGYDQGYNHGRKESMDAYKELLSEANSIVSAATKDYYTKLEKSDETIVKLAVHTAEKIIKCKLDEQPEVFLDVINTAISEIKDQSMISIYLHPNNYTFVTLQKDQLVGVLDGDTNLSIFIDREITVGSCIIEHPFGQVDASIDTQLDEIRDVLYGVVNESRI